MNIVDANVAIVATATASFIAAYDIKDKKTVEALSEAFVGFAEKWYTENNKTLDLSGIAQAHEMAAAVSKMMSFGK